MPWTSKDVRRHTYRARSAKRKRQWRDVANSVLRRTGDEGAAVRAANSVVKRTVQKRKQKSRHSSRHHTRSARRQESRR
jgi:hypothetical protein